MSQNINDDFKLNAGLALDDRYRKDTIAERDAISSTRRYTGLLCYVEQTNTLYILLGGITNSDWLEIGSPATNNNFYTVDGYPFIWQKGRNRSTGVINNANEMEQYDLILSGFALYESEYKLIKLAEYNTGDPSLIASYNVLEYL